MLANYTLLMYSNFQQWKVGMDNRAQIEFNPWTDVCACKTKQKQKTKQTNKTKETKNKNIVMNISPKLDTTYKVYLKSKILIQEYWTIQDHFCAPVLELLDSTFWRTQNITISILLVWYTRYIPVFINTETFRCLGPYVYLFRHCFLTDIPTICLTWMCII